MQNISIFDQRRSNIHISVTDDQKLESPLGPYYVERSTFLCGRRAKFNSSTKLEATRHVRVASAHMPYRDAKLHGRGLKIYLCRVPASTGALNAAAGYVKMKMFCGRC